MQNLISQLLRLYLPHDATTHEALAQHLSGAQTLALNLVDGQGLTRALMLPFTRLRGDAEDGHWQRLCALANALQQDLELPAPAVSIDGGQAFGLWMSLATPITAQQAHEFATRLLAAYVPEYPLASLALEQASQLPPSLNQATGKWAAFIHPGMGAAFIEEAGLDFTPPPTAQLAFLEPLKAITPAQWQHAMEQLAPVTPPAAVAPHAPANQAGLLLKDATLEDIVRHLHGMNIEPTFRYVLAPASGK